MTSEERLHLYPQLVDAIEAYAQEVDKPVGIVANEALSAGLYHLKRFGWFKPRDPNYDPSEAIALLRQAGKGNPPDPGDELPEDLKHLLTEHD